MKPTVGIMLYGSGGQLRDALAEENYRLLARQFVEQGWALHTLTYHDTRREVVRSEARACDAVLVWINPIEPGLDRPLIDSFLEELSASGVLVSALPRVILKIGTKDVLVETQRIGWSIDARMYRSFAEFRGQFPELIRRDGIRVLKQHRGNSGQGVWKVSLVSADFVVQPATHGTPAETMSESALMAPTSAERRSRGLVIRRSTPSILCSPRTTSPAGSRVGGITTPLSATSSSRCACVWNRTGSRPCRRTSASRRTNFP